MSKVRTFSRVFPSYHPLAGEPTYFLEKIIGWLWDTWKGNPYYNVREMLIDLNCGDKWTESEIKKFVETRNTEIREWKHHTIRAGHHFKPGDWFSPRVWSGAPYKSKQIIIAPDIQVKKVWDFEIKDKDVLLDDVCINCDENSLDTLQVIALNDGLNLTDLMEWFRWPKDTGKMQIICWNENVNY